MTDIVERLRADGPLHRYLASVLEAADEIERLRSALQALHDWYVEYARINNLHNDDGTPATFHELLQARAALESKLPDGVILIHPDASVDECMEEISALEAEIERLRAVIVRAKDALLDGQSTQWVHDLLVAPLLEPKP